MILAVRRGQTIRRVARNFGVSKTTVEHWLAHAKVKRLDRVDWNDKQKQQNNPKNRTDKNVEACVLKLRKQRKRYPNPPTGWYLSPLEKQITELDQFDYVEDLCIQGGNTFNVLNGIALHGKLVGSWPVNRMTAENTVQKSGGLGFLDRKREGNKL